MRPKFFFHRVREMFSGKETTSAEQDQIKRLDQEMKAMDDQRGRKLQERQNTLDRQGRALKRSKTDKVERELGKELHRDISAI